MKSIVLLLTGLGILNGLSLTACAQELSNGRGHCAARCEAVEGMYSLDSEGRITISRIIGTYGLSAEEGYSVVKNLIEGNLISAEYGIVADDASECRFTAEGYYDAFYRRKPGAASGLGCHVDSRLCLESRNGRIKVTITVLNYRNDAINVDARTVWPFCKKDNRNRNITGVYSVAEPITVPKSHASRYFNAAVTDADALLTEIERAFSRKRTENDW